MSNDKNLENKNFKHIIRIANTDLKGEKPLFMALQKIKGVSFMFANALCVAAGLDPLRKAGSLSDEEEAQLNKVIAEPDAHGIPNWLLNRRKDLETGLDLHLIGGDIKFYKENDINLLRKIKSYRSLKHAARLPVRGQRTKSNFRPNKGKAVVKKKKTSIRK